MGEVFRRLFYHAVWATSNHEPQLTEALRPHVFRIIRDECTRLGCRLRGINALPDHLHVALEIPPSLAVGAAIETLKDAVLRAMDRASPGAICWQEGYGVVTFREAELDRTLRYIATQEARHESANLAGMLENCGG